MVNCIVTFSVPSTVNSIEMIIIMLQYYSLTHIRQIKSDMSLKRCEKFFNDSNC